MRRPAVLRLLFLFGQGSAVLANAFQFSFTET